MKYVDTSEVIGQYGADTQSRAAGDEVKTERSDGFRETEARPDVKVQEATLLSALRMGENTRQ